jgi:transcriptional regulator of acetoin/glycerol metabolism
MLTPIDIVKLRSNLGRVADDCIQMQCGFRSATRMFQRSFIDRLMKLHGRKREVARAAGLHRNTVHRMVKRQGHDTMDQRR